MSEGELMQKTCFATQKRKTDARLSVKSFV